MAYTNVGAIPMGSSGFDAIKTIQHQRRYALTGSDVMSFTPKSWLQRLFEQLIATVNQRGNPNA